MLEPETLFFGKKYREVVNGKADWTRAATNKEVLTPVNIAKWTIVCLKKHQAEVKKFMQIYMQQGKRKKNFWSAMRS